MGTPSKLHVRVRQIVHSQWRIFRKGGVKGNLASLRRVADNRRVTGMFSTGLRAHVSAKAITRWHLRGHHDIVVVAQWRPDLAAWLAQMPASMHVTLLLPPGRSEEFHAHRRAHVVETPLVASAMPDLSDIRRLLIQEFAKSDVLFIDATGELPDVAGLMALQYAAWRYELTEGRIGAVTPQLVVRGTQERVNGFEWDRVSMSWLVTSVSARDLGQAGIPRYVLSAPLHGLYVRGDVLRGSAVPSGDADLEGQLGELLKSAWQRGWRTLALPKVALASDPIATPPTKPTDLDWLTGRSVRGPDGRLRIIYVLLATTISGGIRTVFEQTEYLLDLGHDVQIWSLQGPPDWTTSRTPIVTFENHRDLTAALAGEHAIKIATWWETAQVVWLASVNNGVPLYYVQEFETWFYPEDAVARAAVAASYRLEMDHVAIAQYQADELAEIGVPATVISSAYDESKFRPLGAARSADTVMAVGRTFFQKNFAMTLAAWRSLDAERPRLLLYGFEPEIARDRLIEYVERPTDAQINELYNRATVFVQTSRHEGFCLPVLEAMAAGCPVITTDSHGNRDFCFDGVNCIIVEQDDAEGLAAAIRRVLGDQELQERLRQAGLNTAQDYTWRVAAKKLEARYLSLA